jgi:hypothetical protein
LSYTENIICAARKWLQWIGDVAKMGDTKYIQTFAGGNVMKIGHVKDKYGSEILLLK